MPIAPSFYYCRRARCRPTESGDGGQDVFSANFISGGVQKQLTSTATVKIVK
jgi:hypothetical protein